MENPSNDSRFRRVYAEHRDFGRELYSVRSGSEKVIYQRRPTPSLQRFELDADPVENEPITATSGLSARLEHWIDADRRVTAPVPLSPEQAQILEKLGYGGSVRP